MSKPSRSGRRLHIARLDVDLRGIAPRTGEAAARALGPALARVLTQSRDSGFGIGDSGSEIDAGRIDSPASPDAHDLAARLAQRIAQALGGEEP